MAMEIHKPESKFPARIAFGPTNDLPAAIMQES